MSKQPKKPLDPFLSLCARGRPSVRSFRACVRRFYRDHGRSFAWRNTRDPYRVLVSEVMLQQTQADRVVPKFREFLKRFPSWRSLAQASSADVMRAWQGLGYYRRAFNLQRAAQAVVRDHRGRLPADAEAIRGLPGVGSYTAGAVCAFAFGVGLPIVETNIRSVYLYAFFPRRRSVSDGEILALVEATLDVAAPREWYYALMDLGSELKKEKRGINSRSKHHTKQSPYHGSNRQARAAVLKALAERGTSSERRIAQLLGADPERVGRAVDGLLREGLVRRVGRSSIALP